MPKPRNTRELIQRAIGHRRAGHIQQGTYFDHAEGRTPVKVCAVGCLANPWPLDKDKGYVTRRDNQYAVLAREFGICSALAQEADTTFEDLGERAAKRFPEEFARALPKRDIRDRDVARFLTARNGADIYEPNASRDALLHWLKTGELPKESTDA